jgi:hypothetical protein
VPLTRRRHDANEHVTVPTNLGSQISILSEGFVCKMSAGDSLGLSPAVEVEFSTFAQLRSW